MHGLVGLELQALVQSVLQTRWEMHQLSQGLPFPGTSCAYAVNKNGPYYPCSMRWQRGEVRHTVTDPTADLSLPHVPALCTSVFMYVCVYTVYVCDVYVYSCVV